MYSFIRRENIAADGRVRAWLSNCNHVTDVGGARGQVASLITGVDDRVTCSLYFSGKLVGLVLKVATKRYRNFMETVLIFLLTVLRNGQACTICRFALALSIIYYDLFNCR